MTDNQLNKQADEGERLAEILRQMQQLATSIGAVEIPLNSKLAQPLLASLHNELEK